ncbi:uncharacterized protein I206_101328 [Kwoniella pini CBS 10737]|uniref:Amino acid permease/ SLC12A domain-containing protein n=1 Tax=Kwoniella pini CBS 10737 TaxID=1296096 RepID=A0A1B9HX04_9TREE|nr:uncharacterized protein I206_06704 [Kwoniella pini CBS 10737]OCF47797.1 hypothetical protein I206_06704 [Kwoniella pini CBS 10737]
MSHHIEPEIAPVYALDQLDNDVKSQDKDLTPSSINVLDAEDQHTEPVVQVRLERRLQSRHMQMIAFGGVIGSGFFVALGSGFHSAGPAGLLISFSLVGCLLWIVMQAVGEMSAFMPISGSFMAFSTKFIDESVGFAIGWGYWFLWATLGISEYNTMTILLSYWNTHIPSYGWILLFNVFFLVITTRGVRVFGELELILCTFKIIFIILVMILSIIVAAGGVNNGPVLGFTYWRNPGAFANGFVGVFKTLPLAANFMVGSEMLGTTAGECANPAREVPKAAKQVTWRILFVFILGIFLQGMIVPYDDPQLLNGASPTARAVIAIAMNRNGITGIGHAVTAFCLVANISALNGTMFIASRALANLGFVGHGPKFLTKVSKRGVPVYGVIITNTIGLLALLNTSAGPGQLFTWLVNISGIIAFLAWCTICLCHIRFRAVLRAQNIPLSELPWISKGQPWFSWIGLIASIFFTLISGWTAFYKGFDYISFLQSYIILPVFFGLIVGFKLIRKNPRVDLRAVDLRTGRSVWSPEDFAVSGESRSKRLLRRGRELVTG